LSSIFLIAPGITGWAQVNYPYGANEEDARQKLMYDLYYIKNWSLWLEIKTIFKTILVMIGGKGL
jgi:lipopolysaccharide/colanic/teichoic acid biosynthesis glycosyltransferase